MKKQLTTLERVAIAEKHGWGLAQVSTDWTKYQLIRDDKWGNMLVIEVGPQGARKFGWPHNRQWR